MDKIDVTKKTLRFLNHTGAGTIVGQIVKDNITPRNTYEKVTVFVAGAFISSALGAAATVQSDKVVDDLAEAWKETNPEYDLIS